MSDYSPWFDMSCCSDFCLGLHGVLAVWGFLLLLFENFSKSDVSHANIKNKIN